LQGFDTDCFILNQKFCKSNLSKLANKRQTQLRSINTFRGFIYDRNGEILAMSLPRQTLCINFSEINQQKNIDLKAYEPLLVLLNIKKDKFKKIFTINKNKKEYYLKRKLPDSIVTKIRKLNLPSIYFIDEYHRTYPGGRYFSNIIGFTNIDDIGQEGIEYANNNLLTPIKGLKKIKKDNFGRQIETIEIVKPPKLGQDIHLSLDKYIQLHAYNTLKKHVKKTNADSASLVLIKNTTGEIITMVNYPSFNPSNRSEMKGEKIKNKVVTDIIEPGSTMKPFIIYTALESGNFDNYSVIDTAPGFLEINGHTIKDYKYLGKLDLKGIITKSSNVGAALVALGLDKKHISDNLEKLQFGKSLYIGLPGEQKGNLHHYKSWEKSEHASISYGYGLDMTLLHLANAYAILANYGNYIELTYLKHLDNDKIHKKKILDKELSKNIIKMMTNVVSNDGTAKKARLEKYSVAGKTGTAKMIENGKYSDNKYVVLFVGIVPASKPEFVSVIILRNPKVSEPSGGKNAAPIFKEFMGHTLNLLQVYPDKHERQNISKSN
tara:strand:+ start:32980 stop:34626 length:1647 start_codon:yes stop_codon:yes gene_type:complete